MSSKFIIWLVLSLLCSHSMLSQKKEEVDSVLKKALTIGNLEKSLSKTEMALKIATSIKYREGILRAKFSKAILYYMHSNTNECLRIIERIEPEILSSNDNVFIAHLLYVKGLVYMRLNLINNAIDTQNRALLFSDKISNDNERHHRKSKVYLALAALNDASPINNDHAVILGYLKKAYKESILIENNFDNESLVTTSSALGSYYSHKKDFSSAKVYFKKAISLSNKIKCERCQTYSYNRIGKMYYIMKDYNNAAKNYERSVELGRSMGDLVMLQQSYKDLSMIYEKLNESDKQIESLQMLKDITDSIDNSNNLVLEKAVQGITNEIQVEHKENTSQLKIYIIIGGTLCIWLLCFAFIYLKKYRSEQANNVRLEKSLNEKAFYIQSMNSSKSIIEKEEELKSVIRMAMTNDILFFQAFNELFPDFKQKLLEVDPFFRANDLKFCFYLKLNFDTKEIARYAGGSVRSVESKKYRLRKKFNISSQEDINAWISKF